MHPAYQKLKILGPRNSDTSEEFPFAQRPRASVDNTVDILHNYVSKTVFCSQAKWLAHSVRINQEVSFSVFPARVLRHNFHARAYRRLEMARVVPDDGPAAFDVSLSMSGGRHSPTSQPHVIKVSTTAYA